MRWIDVGIMDPIFASYYLVDHPINVVSGNVPTCGLAQNPINQMSHLAKKIVKAQHRNDLQAMAICCYRYLGWWKISNELSKKYEYNSANEVNKLNPITNINTLDSEIGKLYCNYNFSIQTLKIVEIVLRDIGSRFPDIIKASP
jgi:hypothetical protein